jgi:hypothetical protein
LHGRSWRCGGVTPTGVGTGGPPSYAKYPFSESKVPFSCMKNVIKIAFFAQRALLKTLIYVISGKLFSFPGKISHIGKIFWYIRKMFSYLGKNVIYPENYFCMSGKFF